MQRSYRSDYKQNTLHGKVKVGGRSLFLNQSGPAVSKSTCSAGGIHPGLLSRLSAPLVEQDQTVQHLGARIRIPGPKELLKVKAHVFSVLFTHVIMG